MLYALSLDSAKRTPIMAVESTVSFVSSRDAITRGYLLFSREGVLLAQPFDVRQLRTTGDSFVVAEHIGSASFTGITIRYAHFSASGSTLAYWQDTDQPMQLSWFSRSGKRIGIVGKPSPLGGFTLSPDRYHVAALIGDFPQRNADLWLIENQRGTSLRLTFERGLGFGPGPVFSPDGTKVAFSVLRNGVSVINQKSTSGSDADNELVKSNDRAIVSDWSLDGKYIAYTVLDPQSTGDIWILPLAGDRRPFPYVNTPASEEFCRFSPDGKWIAYTSDQGLAASAGSTQVYVQSFNPDSTNSSRWQISVNGGRAPQWRDDGKELFYVEGRKVMAARIRTSGKNFEAGIPEELFEAPPSMGGIGTLQCRPMASGFCSRSRWKGKPQHRSLCC
jgi:Tol biopolymer transport system component